MPICAVLRLRMPIWSQRGHEHVFGATTRASLTKISRNICLTCYLCFYNPINFSFEMRSAQNYIHLRLLLLFLVLCDIFCLFHCYSPRPIPFRRLFFGCITQTIKEKGPIKSHEKMKAILLLFKL